VKRKPNWLEKVSAPILLKIHSWPRYVFPLLLGSVLVAGLFFSNPLISSALLGLVSLTLLWLVALSWPLLTSPQRLIRTLLIAALIFYAISRVTGSV
jgi:hypothetical protein